MVQPKCSTAGKRRRKDFKPCVFYSWSCGLFGCWEDSTAFALERPLAGTQPLTLDGDLSAQMVSGIDRFLMREIEQSTTNRAKVWQRDLSSAAAYTIRSNRTGIGCVNESERWTIRLPVADLNPSAASNRPARIAEGASYTVDAVRWPVFFRACMARDCSFDRRAKKPWQQSWLWRTRPKHPK